MLQELYARQKKNEELIMSNYDLSKTSVKEALRLTQETNDVDVIVNLSINIQIRLLVTNQRGHREILTDYDTSHCLFMSYSKYPDCKYSRIKRGSNFLILKNICIYILAIQFFFNKCKISFIHGANFKSSFSCSQN